MNKKILLTLILTFVITALLTLYTTYLLQSRRLTAGLSSSQARRAAPVEDQSGSTGSQTGAVGGGSFSSWIQWTITTTNNGDYSWW